jgi:hypothetical protein
MRAHAPLSQLLTGLNDFERSFVTRLLQIISPANPDDVSRDVQIIHAVFGGDTYGRSTKNPVFDDNKVITS